MQRLSDIVFSETPLKLTSSATVLEACRSMCESECRATLVIGRGDSLVGIFTTGDAVRRVLATHHDPATTALATVMTKKPVVMAADGTALDAVQLMWDGGFRHVPVVAKGKVLGIVCRGGVKGAGHACLEEERDVWHHIRHVRMAYQALRLAR